MPSLMIKLIHVWLADWWSGHYKERVTVYHSRLVTNTAQKLRDDKDEVGCWKAQLIIHGFIQEQLWCVSLTTEVSIMSQDWCHYVTGSVPFVGQESKERCKGQSIIAVFYQMDDDQSSPNILTCVSNFKEACLLT